MIRRLLMGVLLLGSACGGPLDRTSQEASSPRTAEQRLAFFDYSAEDTNSAQNTSTSAQVPVSLAAGETVMIGTCGLTDSFHAGDTYLRLYNPSSVQVAESDDACGLGSIVSYTSPSTGTYLLQAGCLGNSACSGTLSISRRKAIYTLPSLLNTNSARTGTFNRQYFFNGGEVIRVSTCATTAYGATATGDTFLRIFQQANGTYTTEVASNDNGCASNSTASEIVYFVPSAGYYQIRAGCFGNTACSGTVAVYIE